MNSIRQTQLLNKRELESAVPPSASWHADYRDTAYIYVGGFPFDLSEGDLLTIFSQYGNPTHLNLIRDRETGKSKGFAFLKYEDQRSCDLAVDNLGGAEVLGRTLRVDHTRYKKRDDEDEDTWRVDRLEGKQQGEGTVDENGRSGSDVDETDDGGRRKPGRVMLKEERELRELLRIKDGEEEDPMKGYIIEEKRAEVKRALAKMEKKERHHHKHHHNKHKDREGDREHRSRRHRDGDNAERRHRNHHIEEDRGLPHHKRADQDRHERRSYPRQRRRPASDDGESRSRSRSSQRGHEDTARPRSKPRKPFE